ncbi:sigma-70 family RNA polymerase sigma factor [Candidatus Uhrbacteria bacterium]|nr:sigma-70 family RNA polymerase sigma factor [Candidatus Uhrbacteria bacterium]
MQGNREKFLLMRIRVFKDESAFAKLYEEYGSRFQRFLYVKLPSQEDVDEAFSTLWLRIWEYATTTPIEHFSGLAHTIARGIVAQFYSSKEKNKEDRVRDDELIEDVAVVDPTSKVHAKIDIKFLLKAMKGKLSEEEQEAVILRYLEGYSIGEIAAYLGKGKNATSVLITRAIKKIGNLLQPPSS